MRIRLVEVSNFRKLKSVRLELSDEVTLFVGANNSGKTTAMDALRQFLTGAPFRLSDLTLSDLPELLAVGEMWEADSDEGPDVWQSLLPTLDIWLEAEEEELHRATQLLPVLDGFVGLVGVRLRLEPKDLGALRAAYISQRSGVEQTLAESTQEQRAEVTLWPADLIDFLDRALPTSFHVACYSLDPGKISPPLAVGDATIGVELDPEVEARSLPQSLQEGQVKLTSNPLRELIRVDVVNAQRGLGADDGNSRLSRQVTDYYDKHLDATKSPTLADLSAIQATQAASRSFDQRLEEAFKIPLDEISNMGYPGGSNPRVVIRTSLSLTDGLKQSSVLKYRLNEATAEHPAPLLELPENLNGLGYQNLVLMIFNLLGFRDARLHAGKAASAAGSDGAPIDIVPIHLVLVEEPEAHLHAQVQQVFIRRAYDTLKPSWSATDYPNLVTQLVVSTHSGHIAHELNFASIRYFRRNATAAHTIPTSDVRDLSEVFGSDDDTARFVERYIKLDHCDLLFADAAVFFEGASERILLPHFIERDFSKIHESYVEYLEIGGAHAHRLKGLVELLGIPVLVITDVDAADPTSKTKVRPQIGASHLTSNSTLSKWLDAPTAVDDLSALPASSKILASRLGGSVRFAFQTDTEVFQDGQSLGSAIASTFEDAIALSNFDAFTTMTGLGLTKKFKAALTSNDTLPEIAEALFDALKTGDKAAFALDLLWAKEFDKIAAPAYIADGLEWLSEQVEALPTVPSAPVTGPSPELTEQADNEYGETPNG